MGFRDSIERETQQREETLFRSRINKKIPDQVVLDAERRINEKGAIFLDESEALGQLLDCLDDSGYVDYLQEVVNEGTFNVSLNAFMRYTISRYPPRDCIVVAPLGGLDLEGIPSWYRLYSTDIAELGDYDLEMIKQLRDSEKILGDKLFKTQYQINPKMSLGGMGPRIFHPDTQYFGDIEIVGRNGILTEPKEVGLGFRFSKMMGQETKRIYRDSRHYTQTTFLHGAFYVRVISPHNAVVTGLDVQEEVELGDISAFDKALERISAQMVIYYKDTKPLQPGW